MKKGWMFLCFVFICTVTVFPAAEETESYEIDFTAGLRFSYNRVPIVLGEEELENSLVFPFLVLEIDVDIYDFLTLGVMAGYNQNYFDAPVNFLTLPLSLSVDRWKSNSMVLGANLQGEIVSFDYFSLVARGEFLYFKLFKTEKPLELPASRGSVELQNSFTQLTLDLRLEYHGLTGVAFFLGPRLNMISGELGVIETLEDISGEQALDFHQKKPFGFSGGVKFELGSSLDVVLTGAFLSGTSLSAGVVYLF